MIVQRSLCLRISALVIASIGALTIGVTAFTYSGAANRETVRTLARSFFVQMWKGSQARATTKNAFPTAPPDGRIIQ